VHIGKSKVAAALDRAALIDALDGAFRGTCIAPTRHHHDIEVPGDPGATMLLMPAWIPGRYVGTKVANVFPSNRAHALAAVQSVYLLFSGRTGELMATLDGAELTTRRTVAASSLAARYLARVDATRLLIVGTGQVASQIAASHATVRPIRQVDVWGRNAASAEILAARLRGDGFEARAVSDLRNAAAQADVVTCCTLSTEPLVHGAWLRPGAHVDLIGGFTPAMREVDNAAVAKSTIFVDTHAALQEAGDLVIPLKEAVIRRDAIVADIADLVSGRHPGRRDAGEITLFKSVGTAIEDLAAAILCLQRIGPSGDGHRHAT
jgi:alanine dehydrogenase